MFLAKRKDHSAHLRIQSTMSRLRDSAGLQIFGEGRGWVTLSQYDTVCRGVGEGTCQNIERLGDFCVSRGGGLSCVNTVMGHYGEFLDFC